MCPFQEMFIILAPHVSFALVVVWTRSSALRSTCPSSSTHSIYHLAVTTQYHRIHGQQDCLVVWPYKFRSHSEGRQMSLLPPFDLFFSGLHAIRASPSCWVDWHLKIVASRQAAKHQQIMGWISGRDRAQACPLLEKSTRRTRTSRCLRARPSRTVWTLWEGLIPQLAG